MMCVMKQRKVGECNRALSESTCSGKAEEEFHLSTNMCVGPVSPVHCKSHRPRPLSSPLAPNQHRVPPWWYSLCLPPLESVLLIMSVYVMNKQRDQCIVVNVQVRMETALSVNLCCFSCRLSLLCHSWCTECGQGPYSKQNQLASKQLLPWWDWQ